MDIDIGIGIGDIERDLMEVFARACGLGSIGPSTPMNEIRARAEKAGIMTGRAMGAILHEGPISADIAMVIRSFEEDYKARFLRSVTRVAGPGGKLRGLWDGQDSE